MACMSLSNKMKSLIRDLSQYMLPGSNTRDYCYFLPCVDELRGKMEGQPIAADRATRKRLR